MRSIILPQPAMFAVQNEIEINLPVLTSLDISDVDTVWTWGDKRPPHKKREETRDFEEKNSIRNMVEIA